MAIIIENGLDDSSSDPGWECLYFTSGIHESIHISTWGKALIHLFFLRIVGQIRLANLVGRQMGLEERENLNSKPDMGLTSSPYKNLFATEMEAPSLALNGIDPMLKKESA